jgi:hypothetical protein
MSDNLTEWKRRLRVLQRQVDICRGLQPRGTTALTDEQKAHLFQNTRDAEDALRIHYDKLKRH